MIFSTLAWYLIGLIVALFRYFLQCHRMKFSAIWLPYFIPFSATSSQAHIEYLEPQEKATGTFISFLKGPSRPFAPMVLPIL